MGIATMDIFLLGDAPEDAHRIELFKLSMGLCLMGPFLKPVCLLEHAVYRGILLRGVRPSNPSMVTTITGNLIDMNPKVNWFKMRGLGIRHSPCRLTSSGWVSLRAITISAHDLPSVACHRDARNSATFWFRGERRQKKKSAPAQDDRHSNDEA
jgi:hypothetical protein